MFRGKIIVSGVAIVALVRRFKITNFLRLSAGHLYFIWDDISCLCGAGYAKAYTGHYHGVEPFIHFFILICIVAFL
jgi:hypothetical protein